MSNTLVLMLGMAVTGQPSAIETRVARNVGYMDSVWIDGQANPAAVLYNRTPINAGAGQLGGTPLPMAPGSGLPADPDVDVSDASNLFVATWIATDSLGSRNVYLSRNGASPIVVANGGNARVTITRNGQYAAVAYTSQSAGNGGIQVRIYQLTGGTTTFLQQISVSNNVGIAYTYNFGDIDSDDGYFAVTFVRFDGQPAPGGGTPQPLGVVVRAYNWNGTQRFQKATTPSLAGGDGHYTFPTIDCYHASNGLGGCVVAFNKGLKPIYSQYLSANGVSLSTASHMGGTNILNMRTERDYWVACRYANPGVYYVAYSSYVQVGQYTLSISIEPVGVGSPSGIVLPGGYVQNYYYQCSSLSFDLFMAPAMVTRAPASGVRMNYTHTYQHDCPSGTELWQAPF